MEFCKNRENPVNETEKKMFVKQGNNVTKTENNYSDPAISPEGLIAGSEEFSDVTTQHLSVF